MNTLACVLACKHAHAWIKVISCIRIKRPNEWKPDTTLNGWLLGDPPPSYFHPEPHAHKMGQPKEILWFWGIDDHGWSTGSEPVTIRNALMFRPHFKATLKLGFEALMQEGTRWRRIVLATHRADMLSQAREARVGTAGVPTKAPG